MATDTKTADLNSLWERLELRTSFMEGVTAFGPITGIVGIGALSGLLLVPLGLPVWFTIECLFTDHLNWPVDLSACRPSPPFAPSEWALAAGWFTLIGVGYLLLFRLSILSAKLFRIGPASLHAGHAFAILAAVGTCLIMGRGASEPGLSRSEALVMIVSGPVWLRLWWTVRLKAYGYLAARLPQDACAWTVKVLLSRQFRLESPGVLDVAPDEDFGSATHPIPAKLIVKGPFDAVDERRIADLVKTRLFDTVEDIAVITTMNSSDYWTPYREELGPSGYQSPPIPPPLTVPTPVVWSAAAVAALFFGYVAAFSGIAAIGEDHLEASLSSVSRGIDQLEAGWDPTRETGVDTSFYLINLRDSKVACPQLSRDVMARWRIWNEDHGDRYVYRVHQVSQVDYLGFVIDGVSHTCIQEIPGRNLREAQYLIASRVSAHEWIRIDDSLDWRYVPPRPHARY